MYGEGERERKQGRRAFVTLLFHVTIFNCLACDLEYVESYGSDRYSQTYCNRMVIDHRLLEQQTARSRLLYLGSMSSRLLGNYTTKA